MKSRSAMRYWLWAVATAIIFHLIGLGRLFTDVIGGLLILAVAIGGLAIMLLHEKAARLLGLAVISAVGLLVIPLFLADLIRRIWRWDPMLFGFKVVIGLAVTVGLATVLGAAYTMRHRLSPRKSGDSSSLPGPPLRSSAVRRPRRIRSRVQED